MLKIKDNVDLKELEKYEFEELCYSNNISWFWVKKDVSIDSRSKHIELYEETDYLLDDDLDILYDLIKADLVEKIEE